MDFSAAFQMDVARCLVLSVVQAMLSRLLEKSHNLLHNTTGELCTLQMYVPVPLYPTPPPTQLLTAPLTLPYLRATSLSGFSKRSRVYPL